MILYFSPGACSLPLRILINELGLECKFEKVDLANKKLSNGDDFFKVVQKGVVPALGIENGDVVTEGAVILQYLAESVNSDLLAKAPSMERYKTLEWVNFVATDLHKGVGNLFARDFSDEIKSALRLKAAAKLKIADEMLGSNKFAMGDKFTIADPYLYVIISWLPHVGMNIADFPNLARFFSDLSQRPSVKKSLEQEGLI